MHKRLSFRVSAALIAAMSATTLWATPRAIAARQSQSLGSGGGQITESLGNPKAPTLVTMSRFTGTWSCSIGQVATSSFKVSGMMSPQGGAFVLQTPTTVAHFTNAAGSLQFSRTSTAGGTVNYALSSYAPHGTDLIFQETNPNSRGGSAPAATFTPTFEIKRDARVLLVTSKSPKFGTLDYSCSRA